jgi:hypothetical protein
MAERHLGICSQSIAAAMQSVERRVLMLANQLHAMVRQQPTRRRTTHLDVYFVTGGQDGLRCMPGVESH